MKAIRFYFISLTACLLFLTSCSKDDNTLIDTEQETAILSFGPELIDLATKATSKQSVDDLPACTDDDASYVMIILSQDGSNIVGSEAAPFRVDLAPGQDFTVEVPELELTPGQYMLEYFAVHNEAGDLIWIAPNGGIFESFFEDPMPMIIDLGAGVKKYLEVPVVCFDDRFVNQYGYLFFELDTIEAIEFCIFGNYCDETGRHYPAAFSVDVWTYENGATGEQLYNDLSNEVTLNNDGDYAGTTVCMALPDTPGLNEYYVEITLLNSDAYGNVTEEVIRSGVITDQDVKDLFVGADANEYYHFREGNCNMDDSPNLFEEGGGNGGECDPNDPNADCDSDGVNNSADQCPGTLPGLDVDARGCENVNIPGSDVVVFNDVNIFDNTSIEDPDNVKLLKNLVNFTTAGVRNNGNVVWFDKGRNASCGSPCDGRWSTMYSIIENEGFQNEDIFSSSGTLSNIPSNVKIIFLLLPAVDYTLEEINTLKAFAAQGGRIVFVGEHDGYYNHIPVQNQFLLNMGAVLRNTGGAVDCDYTTIPETSNREHPIMEGVSDIMIACASVIEPGPNDFALFYDSSNSVVLAGVAKIETAPIAELKGTISMSLMMDAPKVAPDLPVPSSETGY
jgi:hypothetical protein